MRLSPSVDQEGTQSKSLSTSPMHPDCTPTYVFCLTTNSSALQEMKLHILIFDIFIYALSNLRARSVSELLTTMHGRFQWGRHTTRARYLMS